ncbi:MAG: OmpA family protein [Cytophagales bacterium]|nr:OmpA family protein [Cytophagales bacterium]
MKEVLIILLSLNCFNLFAQRNQAYTSRSKKAIAYYQESEMFMVRRQYEQAIKLLDLATDKDDDFVEAYNRKGYIYGLMRYQEEAKMNYLKVVELEPKNPKFSNAYYFLSEIALKNGDYDKAKELVDRFLSIQPVDRKLAPQAGKILQSIQYARDNMGNRLPFNARPLPDKVNALSLQYFPVLTADQQSIIFTGRKGLSANYDEDLYISEKDENGEWSRPVSISDMINTSNNEGTCTISGDGRTLIFTSCLGRKGYGSCDLFISYKIGDEWTRPKNLGSGVNSRYWESQPSLSADGRTLYFVSDRPGGLGKRDIYVSYLKKDGIWSPPVNLSKPVNTKEDEVSPFIHANGQTLYFASDGHPGFGSFDLFYSELSDNVWQKPKNLGYPINTYEEQVSLFVTSDGKRGYYSNENLSKRVGAKSALYEFDMPQEIQVSHKSNFVKGRVIDSETREYLSARVELFDLLPNEMISSVTSDKVSGEYLMVITEGKEYALYVNKTGYLFKSLAFDYQGASQLEPVSIDIYLDPIKTGTATILNNLFFDFDKYELQEKSITELEKVRRFLEENPTVNIGIAGHTDNSGSASYNKELSVNRAKSVYRYLIKQGIRENRLKFRGYGQEKPIAPNDTEENKQKNRRIEFVIL